MILLNGHSLTAARAVPVVSMSLQMKERESSATMVPAQMDGIAVGSWLMDDREPEAGAVWKVKSIQQAFDTNTPTVQMDHVISTLKDLILFGEIKADTITGNPDATSYTARQAVEYILSQQSDWVLGQFDYGSVSNPYKFDGDTLFEALETVTNTLEDAWWTYDTSVYPFVLNITNHSADVDSEMRAGRNLRTISRTIDTSGMYTRFYPIGKDDLHISGNYVEKNTNLYGVISKIETDQSLETEAELTAWANERLNKHAQPVVTITAEGLELSRATGENLDALTIGRVCRIPLPEYDTVIEERITEKNYPDKVNQPEIVKITLANSRTDITKIIAEAMRKSGRGGRGSARQAKEDHAWFEDTNDHVSMTAVGIIGVNAQGNPNWTRLSEFIADGEGLHAKVETAVDGVNQKMATLEINEEQIRADVTASKSEIYSFIEQTASQIVIRVGESNMVFKGTTKPTGSTEHPLVDGDLWLETNFQRNWEDMEELDSWIDDENFDWSEMKGSKIHVYDAAAGDFREVIDEQVLAQDADIDETSGKISLIARSVKQVDDKVGVYRAEFQVKADQITSSVNERIEGVGSSITQTAKQIRSEVHAAQSTMYSAITQTASSIRLEVANTASGLSSSITQTASQIRSEVNAAQSTIYTSITQTASQIRSEVANTASGLSSRITQNANKVAIVVDDQNNLKTASIVAGINDQTGSYVKIKAETINLSGYVTASQLSAVEADITNLTTGRTTASYLKGSYVSASSGFFFKGETIQAKTITINGTTYHLLGY